MELLSPVVDIVLFFWNPVSRRIRYLTHLNNNVETLKQETEELQDKHNGIQADVDHAVSVGKTRKPLVDNWLEDARSIEAEVNSIILEFEERRTCFNGCCTDYFSRYKLGKRVLKKLEDVKNLKVKGVFDKVAESPRPMPERQPSLPRGQQNTFNKTKEEILQCLHNEENGVVGVYGMGGIGKTTLMGAINDSLIRTGDFSVVIWVTVSKDLNLGIIQEQIGKKLEIRFDSNEDIEERRHKLYAQLKNVRYLLILDDLWEKFSLKQLGIPKPDKINRCKIAITTRSFAVCNDMGVDKAIKIRALMEEEAWNFFCETCGDVVQLPEIRPVAEEVVEECGGLPLAIKTVGGAMKRKDRKEVWENALRALKRSSPEVPGMESEVFLPLKFSYDCLENEEIKLCFLYCSLFPEDYLIGKDDLVRYWAMEEGFIKKVNNLEEALNKGHYILERIKDACLLEEGIFFQLKSTQFSSTVKMHDLLRDLAIWITSQLSSSSKDGSKFFVKTGEGLVQPPEEKMWGGMVRISLMRNKIEHLQITPDCPHLVSLFLNDNDHLRTIHSGFFELMPNLQILDLSNTCIESLPVSLSLLMNLRALVLTNCRHLVEVSQLGKLEELQLLDLSGSGLKSLPQGIASLVRLKWLDLSCMEDLIAIRWDMIFGLPSLEDLRMLGLKHVDGTTFSEAATMTRLTSLRIELSNLNGFIAHDMFHRWFSGLRRFEVRVAYQNSRVHRLDPDKHIIICGGDNFPCGIEGLIKHATTLCLTECKGLTSLSQLLGDSKNLIGLSVHVFSGVECIIDWREVGDDAFQCLQWLELRSLPNLEKVFDGGAPQPNTRLQNLRRIDIKECHKLRRLFSSNMVEYLHRLEVLCVQNCSEMEEFIEGDMLPHSSFPRLRFLLLGSLYKLVSICGHRLTFKSLEEMKVISCPKLKKLPLFCSSIHEIKGIIQGEREWWEGLEWEDENARSLCSTIYKEASSEVEEGIWTSQ